MGSNGDIDVFVAHAPDDVDLADQITQFLATAGLRVWLDRYSLVPGDVHGLEYDQALSSCSAGVVVIGEGWAKDPNLRELYAALLERAKVEEIRIIPVRQVNVALPPLPESREPVDFFDTNDTAKENLRRLLERVRELAAVLRHRPNPNLSTRDTNIGTSLSTSYRSPRRPTVSETSILDAAVDVLILKYSGQLHGAARTVAATLRHAGGDLSRLEDLPDNQSLVLPGTGIEAGHVLFHNVGPLYKFGYPEIRAFAAGTAELAKQFVGRGRIGTTVHGPGYGLDEVESLHALVGGFEDAHAAGDLVIIEHDPTRSASQALSRADAKPARSGRGRGRVRFEATRSGGDAIPRVLGRPLSLRHSAGRP